MGTSYSKVIIEFRYNPIMKFTQTDFLEKINNYISQLGYQINPINAQLNVFECNKPAESIHMAINQSQCGVDFSLDKFNIDEYNKKSKDLFGVIKELAITNFNRIGLRVINNINFQSINEVNNKIASNIEIKDSFLDDLKRKADFCSMRFGFKDNEENITLNIQPNEVGIDIMGQMQVFSNLNIDIDIFRIDAQCSNDKLKSLCQTYFNKIIDMNANIKFYV